MSGIAEAPANVVFVACAAALQDGINSARQSVASKGTPSNKENRCAAAVVGECREVYSARTGRPAPESVREVTPGFVRFAEAIFGVLGITVRVDSALRVWRRVSKISQISAGQLSDCED